MTNEELQKATIKADMELQKMKDSIHELQKENKQLRKALETKHYCKYANRCNELYDCTREEYNSMAECNMELWLKNDELQQENKQLKDKIDKAIEYIKENASYGIQEKCCLDDLNYYNCDELLQILGDKENE